MGRRALPVACHVGHWDQCDALADAAYEHFGKVDVLVNNAGLSPLYENLVSVTEELYDKVMDVNLKGPFRLSALIGHRMFEGDGGSIINVSSTASIRPTPTETAYSAAKAGLNNLTQAFALEYGPKVRVNCIMPGPFLTDIAKAWDMDAFNERARTTIPLQRGGQPDEIVGARPVLRLGRVVVHHRRRAHHRRWLGLGPFGGLTRRGRHPRVGAAPSWSYERTAASGRTDAGLTARNCGVIGMPHTAPSTTTSVPSASHVTLTDATATDVRRISAPAMTSTDTVSVPMPVESSPGPWENGPSREQRTILGSTVASASTRTESTASTRLKVSGASRSVATIWLPRLNRPCTGAKTADGGVQRRR